MLVAACIPEFNCTLSPGRTFISPSFLGRLNEGKEGVCVWEVNGRHPPTSSLTLMFLSRDIPLLLHNPTGSNLVLYVRYRRYIPDQRRTLNGLPPELRCRNFVDKHRPSMRIGRQTCRNVYHNVCVFRLSFHFAFHPLVVGLTCCTADLPTCEHRSY